MARLACFYFQVHQPFRIRSYQPFERSMRYFDQATNRKVFERVARRCYLPANQVLLRLKNRFGDRFRVAFSISGTALEQLRLYAPEALASFQRLSAVEAAELLAETYYHSLAFRFSASEFFEQVRLHRSAVERIFGRPPEVFRNTELIYCNAVAGAAREMGFRAVLAEGASSLLGDRSPNRVFQGPSIKVLARNWRLSDDIAFRFTDRSWEGYPLTPEAFAMNLAAEEGDCVNLFMDYETFGEHHPRSSGIFEFLETMCSRFLEEESRAFCSPTQAVTQLEAASQVEAVDPISWADEARDLSAWLGNDMQREAAKTLYELAVAEGQRETWRRLQASDHLYYLSTKGADDGLVHHYFSPHRTPYDAYAAYMNILWDLGRRAG
jgi:alpha-amylase